MFKVINIKPIIMFLSIFMIAVLLGVGIVTVINIENQNIPKPTYTIVVDAGHGGLDVK